MITVFYDGKCGLCTKEINYYRKIANIETFHWLDITHASDELLQEGISVPQALKILHAKDHHGQMHTGIDAFILIWSQLKRWRALARLIALPVIRHTAKIIYSLFAHWRFNRRSRCPIMTSQEKQQ